MKLFKVMAIALLAILGLNSCSNETTPPPNLMVTTMVQHMLKILQEHGLVFRQITQKL
jgi:hypothetical protein